MPRSVDWCYSHTHIFVVVFKNCESVLFHCCICGSAIFQNPGSQFSRTQFKKMTNIQSVPPDSAYRDLLFQNTDSQFSQTQVSKMTNGQFHQILFAEICRLVLFPHSYFRRSFQKLRVRTFPLLYLRIRNFPKCGFTIFSNTVRKNPSAKFV